MGLIGWVTGSIVSARAFKSQVEDTLDTNQGKSRGRIGIEIGINRHVLDAAMNAICSQGMGRSFAQRLTTLLLKPRLVLSPLK